jgi:hypothetical protein
MVWAGKHRAVAAMLSAIALSGCALITGLSSLEADIPPSSDGGAAEGAGSDTASSPPDAAPGDDTGGDAQPPVDAGFEAGSYAATVLADAPLGYWRLDEKKAPTVVAAHDFSGHFADGTYGDAVVRGVPGLLAADPDLAASFPGSIGATNAVLVTERPLLEPATAVSVELWVQPAAGLAPSALVSYGDAANAPHQPYALFLDTAARATPVYAFALAAGGVQVSVYSTTVPTAGQKNHLVGTYDGKAIALYVDGQLESSLNANGLVGHYDTTNGLGIGIRYSDGPVFDGVLDEVAIYGSALSAARVRAHYLAAIGK